MNFQNNFFFFKIQCKQPHVQYVGWVRFSVYFSNLKNNLTNLLKSRTTSQLVEATVRPVARTEAARRAGTSHGLPSTETRNRADSTSQDRRISTTWPTASILSGLNPFSSLLQSADQPRIKMACS